MIDFFQLERELDGFAVTRSVLHAVVPMILRPGALAARAVRDILLVTFQTPARNEMLTAAC